MVATSFTDTTLCGGATLVMLSVLRYEQAQCHVALYIDAAAHFWACHSTSKRHHHPSFAGRAPAVCEKEDIETECELR